MHVSFFDLKYKKRKKKSEKFSGTRREVEELELVMTVCTVTVQVNYGIEIWPSGSRYSYYRNLFAHY